MSSARLVAVSAVANSVLIFSYCSLPSSVCTAFERDSCYFSKRIEMLMLWRVYWRRDDLAVRLAILS